MISICLSIHLLIDTWFVVGGSDGIKSACSAGDLGSIPGSERSFEEGNGYSLQYSCLENSMDKEPGVLWSIGSHRVRHY